MKHRKRKVVAMIIPQQGLTGSLPKVDMMMHMCVRAVVVDDDDDDDDARTRL
jgi:hypothetical protein